IPGMAYLVRRLLENTSNQAWFNMGAAVRETALIEDGKRPQMAEASLQREDGVRVRDANVLGSRGGAEGGASERAFRNTAPAQFFHPAVRAAMRDALGRVRNGFGRRYPLLIGEEEILDRRLAEVAYPEAPSEIIGRVAQGRRDDAEAAVAIAGAAFPAWRDLPPTERGMVLRRAAAIMEERRFDLAAIMVFESAKPWHEADGDVIEAIDYLRYYSAQGERLAERVRLAPDVLGERNEYVYQGRGVTAVISPWNFPLAIPCGMTVGALAAGNCAILKPAAQSPIIAHALISILREAGVPPAVVQYLPGPGSEVGQALAESRGVDNIAFTGSSEVGLRLIETAARSHSSAPGETNGSGTVDHNAAARKEMVGRRPNVKRVIAEMGGKNAVIIDDDADLDQAIHGVIVSAFGYAGQKCSACSRLIIAGSAYEPAAERLKNAVASLVVGPPDDPATIVPPVIGADALERIRRYIESGRQSARLLVQADIGALASSGGYYVAPIVFTDVPLDAPIACEEIFGPVLSVFRARDFEEALGIALYSDFALTGGVFSRNPRHIQQARQAFRVGNLYINRKTTGAIPGRQPFGGLHMSGVGEKAGGPDYVRQFMDARTISENTTRRGFAPEEGD
ncbi:MAG: aldehyde dehydrogenase family protein, partial [Chloroflexi bacterium]